MTAEVPDPEIRYSVSLTDAATVENVLRASDSSHRKPSCFVGSGQYHGPLCDDPGTCDALSAEDSTDD